MKTHAHDPTFGDCVQNKLKKKRHELLADEKSVFEHGMQQICKLSWSGYFDLSPFHF